MSRILRADGAKSFFIRDALQRSVGFRARTSAVEYHVDSTPPRVLRALRPRYDWTGRLTPLRVQRILPSLRSIGLGDLNVVPGFGTHPGDHAREFFLQSRIQRGD